MTITTDPKEVCTHLHGNLYRVRLDAIQFAEPDENSEVLTFSNPRHILGDSAKGFSKEEMAELREAIRTEGLENPILLRWADINAESVLQIVNGERRTRSLLKLYSENAQCYDPESETYKPARELYEYVDCRINNMDDESAFKHAFSSNERSVGIGDGATIALIREFRKADWTDEQILKATGKSISWLRDTDSLLLLDDQTFEALSKEQINRTVALELSKIEDVQDRLDLLSRAQEACSARIEKLKAKLEEQIEDAQMTLEIAESDKVIAEESDDEDFLAEAEESIEDASAKVQSKIETKKKIESSKVTSKDLRKARKTAGNSDAGRVSLTRSKIKKMWYNTIVELVKNDGMDSDGNEIEIDIDDAKLVKLLCERIESGDGDIVQILKQHFKSKS